MDPVRHSITSRAKFILIVYQDVSASINQQSQKVRQDKMTATASLFISRVSLAKNPTSDETYLSVILAYKLSTALHRDGFIMIVGLEPATTIRDLV